MRSSGTEKKNSASMSNTHKHLVNCVKAIILISFIFVFLNMFTTSVTVFFLFQPYANFPNISFKGAFLPNFASKLLNPTGRKLSFSFAVFSCNCHSSNYSTPSS